MKTLTIALLAASIFSQASVVAKGLPYGIKVKSILAENDFSTNNLNSKPWKVSYGKWFVKDGELFSKEISEQDHSPSLSLFFKIPETHMFSFDFKLSETGGMRVALFGKGGLKFIIRRDKITFSASDKSNKEVYPFIIDVAEVALKVGKKHHVDLVVNGHKIIALLDGKPLITAQDPKVNDQGKRYQFTMNPECSFDNFKLSEIELDEKALSLTEFKSGKMAKPKNDE